MGGRNALEFAAGFSQRVTALVMEDIGPDANYAAIDRIERILTAVPAPFASRAEAVTFFANDYAEKIPFYPQPDVLGKFLLANLETKPDGRLDWRFDKPGILSSMQSGRNEDRWDAFANLKMPVLLVRGENSADLPRPIFERMLRTLPAAKGVEIPGAGHWVHFDQPEAFKKALKDFFRATFGRNL